MTLEKDKWYKFDPYNNDWSTTWYMKSDNAYAYKASAYISKSNKDSPFILNGQGYFSNYGIDGKNCRAYVEVTGKELLWLKEIEKRNVYFPFSEMKFDEVINDYNLF